MRGIAEAVFEREGCPIHYWLGGQEGRPLIVLTHGAGMDHRDFDLQVTAVQAEYRILTWDVRAHGLSRPAGAGFTVRRAVEDLLALLDMLGYVRAAFVGHSMGGNIGQEVVFRHPERVAALVMLGCTCNTFRLSRLEAAQLVISGPLLRLYPWGTLKRQGARISAITPAAQRYVYEAMGKLTKADFTRIFVEVARCLHYEPGYNITQPLLLTHGDRDRTGNIRMIAPHWAAREPNCRYVVISHAGHMAQMDNPEAFNTVLLDFLRKHVPVS
jgi:pimeloyl-ACP methyl ester carboxylesterase